MGAFEEKEGALINLGFIELIFVTIILYCSWGNCWVVPIKILVAQRVWFHVSDVVFYVFFYVILRS